MTTQAEQLRQRQQQLDDEAQRTHDDAALPGAGGAVVSASNSAMENVGGSAHDPAVTGTLSVATGALGVREARATYQAARERERQASARGDTQGAADARVDANNAVANGANSGLSMASGGASIAQRALEGAGAVNAAERAGSVSTTLGRIGGGVQAAQGLYNLRESYRNWHRNPDRAMQQGVDGGLQTASGIGALTNNPYGIALGTGIAVGTVMREQADAHAQRTGILGQSNVTTRRGVSPDSDEQPNANLSATDRAVQTGLETRAAYGNTPGATLRGLGSTAIAAPVLTAFSLANRAGLATPNRGNDDIVAADQEERGAPLAPSDRSAVAEHRRRIRRQRDRDAARRAQAAEAQRAQIAADGHVDVMQPERAPANAPFTAINGSNAQSIERRALGMGETREEFEARIARELR